MSEQSINQAGMGIDSDEGVDDLGFTPEQDAIGDGTDSTPTPPDEPVAATDFGTTVRETLDGESLEGRLAREIPDVTIDTPATADESAAGRLVDPDQGAYADTEKDAVAFDAGADDGGLSAEEAAMHVVPE
ncbi:MAG: DUF5709 domain-containing protein [Mycobacteriales bacterium]